METASSQPLESSRPAKNPTSDAGAERPTGRSSPLLWPDCRPRGTAHQHASYVDNSSLDNSLRMRHKLLVIATAHACRGKERVTVYEVLNTVVGVVIAVIVQRTIDPRLRGTVLVLSSIAMGVLVNFVSGELFTSWTYLPFDVAQVLLVACATSVLYDQWQGRPAGLHRAFRRAQEQSIRSRRLP
jgi:hypothetical protein